MKKLISLCLAIAMMVSIATTTYANPVTTTTMTMHEHAINVEFEGMPLAFPDAQPLMDESGLIWLPIRFVSESMGAKVGWEGITKTVTITTLSGTIQIKIGESTALVNGVPVAVSQKIQVMDGRTYIPVDFLRSVLGLFVKYDKEAYLLSVSMTRSEADLIEALDTYLLALEANRNFQGSVLVAQDEKVLLEEGYGYANILEEVKNTKDTQYPIGSITKQFTAISILQLVEKDKLTLEDTLDKFFPTVPLFKGITIEQLLNHTSGLVNYTDLPEFYTAKEADLTTTNLIALVSQLPLKSEAGSVYAYSNTGYMILGVIVEMLSQMSLGDYMEKHIFEPAGMKNTHIAYVDGKTKFDAMGYMGDMKLAPIEEYAVIAGAHGAGNLASTVGDLYLLDRALYTEEILSEESLALMFMPSSKTTEGLGYGLGWFVGQNEQYGNFVFHGGSVPGFSSQWIRFLDIDVTIAITTNRTLYDATTLSNRLFEILLGMDVAHPEAYEFIEISSEELDKFVGVYDAGNDLGFVIANEAGQLYAQFTNQQMIPIYPTSSSTFMYTVIEAEIHFDMDETGNVTGLTLYQSGVVLPAKKLSDETSTTPVVKVSETILASYTGVYQVTPTMAATVTVENGILTIQMTGQEKFTVMAESNDTFYNSVAGVKITFVLDETTKAVTGVKIMQGPITLQAPKVK